MTAALIGLGVMFLAIGGGTVCLTVALAPDAWFQ